MLWLLLLLAQADPPKRAIETQALVDRARGLPPEFAADVLLQLAGSRLIVETKWRRELIEEAFTSGIHAPMPYMRRLSGLATDSRPHQEAAHHNQESLTLQTRTVEAMLAIDPAKAFALYQEIVLPEWPRPTCQDVATPDLSSYYEAASKVFERSFTPRQREKEEDIQFLRQRVGGMRSPAQVVPVLKMLFAAKLTPGQRQELIAAFAATLDRVSGSDREFAAWETQLVSSALPEWHETTLFVPALRAYLVRQASGARCSDSLKSGAVAASVTAFNQLAARLTPKYDPIAAAEVKPLKDEGTFRNQFPWRSARSKQVLAALQWLNHGNRNLPGAERFWTLEERSTPEWNAHYADLLKLIEGWKEDEEESPEDYLFMVATTYAELAQLVPPGPARENALGTWLNFLETRYGSVGSRNLWFAQVEHMLKAAQTAKNPADRQWMLERMARSANPVISVYTQLSQRLTP